MDLNLWFLESLAEAQTVAKLGSRQTSSKNTSHIVQEQIENVDETKDYTKERTEFKNLYYYRQAHMWHAWLQ